MTTPPDPRRPVREYGCCRCQKTHRDGLDPEYAPHLPWQSKHGWSDRPPTVAEVFRRLVEESDCPTRIVGEGFPA